MSIYLIFRICTHTVTTRDYLVFAAISLLFTISASRNQRERRARHKAISDAKARANFDRRRYEEMRREVEAMDEEEYATHPVNVQEFAAKLYRGEVGLEDIPDTRSRAHREYENRENRD